MRKSIRDVWQPTAGKRKSPSPKQGQNKNSLQRILNAWELFQVVLPPKTRREAFEPAYNDIKKDFLLSHKFKSQWARHWLTFCFLCQTLYMIINCFWVAGGAKLMKLPLILVPEVVRRFFR